MRRSTTWSGPASSSRSASSGASTRATARRGEAVADGALGRLLIARAATHDPSPPAESYIAASGGIFRDLHIHDFDALRFVTGEEIVEVYADGAVRETPWFADHGDVDVAAAVLKLSGGALAILSGTRHDPLGYDVRLEALRHPGQRRRRRGRAQPDPLARSGRRAAGLPATAISCSDSTMPTRTSSRRSSRRCSTAVPVPARLHEARAALLVALAADRSRLERRPVAVDEVAGTPVPAG